MSLKRTLSGLGLASFFLCAAAVATANEVNINSPSWLGNLQLPEAQLTKIKEAVEEAMKAPIDATFQCGKVRKDCEVRTAREWMVEGVPYRNIIIWIHNVGSADGVVSKEGGSWPTVKVK